MSFQFYLFKFNKANLFFIPNAWYDFYIIFYSLSINLQLKNRKN